MLAKFSSDLKSLHFCCTVMIFQCSLSRRPFLSICSFVLRGTSVLDLTAFFLIPGRAAEFDTSMSFSSSSAASKPDPPLPAPNLNAAVIVKVMIHFLPVCLPFNKVTVTLAVDNISCSFYLHESI